MLYMKVYFMLVHTFCMPIIVFKIKWICFFLFDFDLHLQRDPAQIPVTSVVLSVSTPLRGAVVANFVPWKNNTKKKNSLGMYVRRTIFLKKKKSVKVLLCGEWVIGCFNVWSSDKKCFQILFYGIQRKLCLLKQYSANKPRNVCVAWHPCGTGPGRSPRV